MGVAVGRLLQPMKVQLGKCLPCCTESYVGQAIRKPVRLVGAYYWSSIGHGPGSPICAQQLSVACQWVLMVLQCVVHCS